MLNSYHIIERWVFCLIFGTVAVVFFLQDDSELGWPGPRYNVSDSMPWGIYWFVPGQVKRGEVVGACLPNSLAKYALAHKILEPSQHPCANGVEPLVKVVAAETGDTVDIESDGVHINGKLWPMSAVRKVDVSGHPIHFHTVFGRHVVPPGKVFLLGLHPRSFDSRVWGEVPRSLITGHWIPNPITQYVVKKEYSVDIS